jgi:hypothetical protein
VSESPKESGQGTLEGEMREFELQNFNANAKLCLKSFWPLVFFFPFISMV